MITSRKEQGVTEYDYIGERRRDGMAQKLRSWQRSSEWSSSMRGTRAGLGYRLCQLQVSGKGFQGLRGLLDGGFFGEGAR